MAHLIHLMIPLIRMAACALWTEVCILYCNFSTWMTVLECDFTIWRIEHGLWIDGDGECEAVQDVKDAIAIWFARLFPSMANEELLLMVATADYESDAFDADSDSSSNP